MTEIKPALTAKEWAFGDELLGYGGVFRDSLYAYSQDQVVAIMLPTGQPGEEYGGQDRHAMAALMLHEQPFGFTRFDADGLRELAKVHDDDADNFELTSPAALWLASLADRIEALLPPEETHATQEEQPSSEPQYQQVREGGHTAADGGSESVVDGS